MEKVITNENGVFLEITEEHSELVSLDELNEKKNLLSEAVEKAQERVVELQERLTETKSRISVLQPKVAEFIAAKKAAEPLVEEVLEG